MISYSQNEEIEVLDAKGNWIKATYKFPSHRNEDEPQHHVIQCFELDWCHIRTPDNKIRKISK